MKISIATLTIALGPVAGRIGIPSNSEHEDASRELSPVNCYVQKWDGWMEGWDWTTQNYCEPKTDCADWEVEVGPTWEQCCEDHCENTGLTRNKPGNNSPVVAPTDAPVAQIDSPVAPTDAPVSPTDAPVAPTNAPVSPPTVGSCWKKTWDWQNDYCYPKPLADCAQWEIDEATTWEQCCEGHCIGEGLTKNKPCDDDTSVQSPVEITTDAPVVTPTEAPVETPTDTPVETPTEFPVNAPTELCAATMEGKCTFPPGAGISSWFTQGIFDEMYPNLCATGCEDACTMLTYPCLIQATLQYPDFANSGNIEDDKRELAGWLGIMGQETTGGGCVAPGLENSDGTCSCSGPSWCDSQPDGGCSRWGLCKVIENSDAEYCSPGGLYPCVSGKSYKGRGPKQLSWNYNYGQFSKEYCGDQNVLLQNPDWVATNPTLAWASSIWFWFSGGACDPDSGEICKPSPHSVFTGKHDRCPADIAANRQYGLGWATNIVNGGLECGTGSSVGMCDYRVYSRVRFYRHYCSILGVEPLKEGWTDDDNLYCGATQNYLESPPEAC